MTYTKPNASPVNPLLPPTALSLIRSLFVLISTWGSFSWLLALVYHLRLELGLENGPLFEYFVGLAICPLVIRYHVSIRPDVYRHIKSFSYLLYFVSTLPMLSSLLHQKGSNQLENGLLERDDHYSLESILWCGIPSMGCYAYELFLRGKEDDDSSQSHEQQAQSQRKKPKKSMLMIVHHTVCLVLGISIAALWIDYPVPFFAHGSQSALHFPWLWIISDKQMDPFRKNASITFLFLLDWLLFLPLFYSFHWGFIQSSMLLHEKALFLVLIVGTVIEQQHCYRSAWNRNVSVFVPEAVHIGFILFIF